MADTKEQAETPEATPEKVQRQEVKFSQPDSKKHIYESVEPTGYKVSINKDRKSWTASDPDGKVLSDRLENRHAGINMVTDLVYPEQAARELELRKNAESAKKPRNLINAKEKTVLNALKALGRPSGVEDLVGPTELDQMIVMGVCANLNRRKLIALENGGMVVSEAGNNALDGYVDTVKAERVKKEREPKDPMARQKKLEEKYGPPPEGVPARPTALEFEKIRSCMQMQCGVCIHTRSRLRQRSSPLLSE